MPQHAAACWTVRLVINRSKYGLTMPLQPGPVAGNVPYAARSGGWQRSVRCQNIGPPALPGERGAERSEIVPAPREVDDIRFVDVAPHLARISRGDKLLALECQILADRLAPDDSHVIFERVRAGISSGSIGGIGRDHRHLMPAGAQTAGQLVQQPRGTAVAPSWREITIRNQNSHTAALLQIVRRIPLRREAC